MMLASYLVPSKTFIIGEYNVLFGGKGILMATEPLFRVEVHSNFDAKENSTFLDFSSSRSDITVQNGANTAGGFGRSSAGFLAVYKQVFGDVKLPKILTFYRSISTSKIKPSGADIATQIFGKIVIFSGEKTTNINWIFKNFKIMIFKTNTKIATHEHLDEVIQVKNLTALQANVELVEKGLVTCDIESVKAGINGFYDSLIYGNLVSETSHKIVKKVMTDFPVLAAKGCGALCNDSIITLVKNEDFDLVKNGLENLGLTYVACTDNVADGFRKID